MDTLEILKNNCLFDGLENDALELVAKLMTKKKIPKNALVFSEGDDACSMYLILEGRVNVTLTNQVGKELILSTLVKGDNFGELSLLDDNSRSANVFTVENCVFAILHKSNFYELIKQNPIICMNFNKYLCNRVRFLTTIAQSLALMDVYGRLVKLLYDFSESTENGLRITKSKLTKQDIASRLGCARESISHIMNALEKGGYIESRSKIITIYKNLPAAF